MENPLDENGSGVDDEKGKVPGEQAGNELDTHAENRARNTDGTFMSKEEESLINLLD